jgi:hypothetical protein
LRYTQVDPDINVNKKITLENAMGAKMSSIDKCLFIYVLFLVCMKLAFYLFMFFGLVDWTMEIIGILKREKRRF